MNNYVTSFGSTMGEANIRILLALRQTTKKFVTLPSRIRSPSFVNKSSVTRGGLILSTPFLILISNKANI